VRDTSIPREKVVAQPSGCSTPFHSGFSLVRLLRFTPLRSITPSFVVFRYCVPQSYVGIIKRSLGDEVMDRQFDSVARKRNYVGEKDT
jgi:hypothetical protein